MFCGLSVSAQNKRMEQRSVVEDGMVKSWVIEKEYDHQGNLINYDSTYSEKPISNNENGFYWDSKNGTQFNFGNGDQQSMQDMMDSLGFGDFNHHQFNFDDLLRNYQEQLRQQNQQVPSDSLKTEEQFIFPEDRKSGKKV